MNHLLENDTMDMPEISQSKSHLIGTISIDEDGVWHVHYLGYHKVLNKSHFGNGVLSLKNLRELLNIVGSRLSNSQEFYLTRIKELKNAKDTSSEVEG